MRSFFSGYVCLAGGSFACSLARSFSRTRLRNGPNEGATNRLSRGQKTKTCSRDERTSCRYTRTIKIMIINYLTKRDKHCTVLSSQTRLSGQQRLSNRYYLIANASACAIRCTWRKTSHCISWLKITSLSSLEPWLILETIYIFFFVLLKVCDIVREEKRVRHTLRKIPRARDCEIATYRAGAWRPSPVRKSLAQK